MENVGLFVVGETDFISFCADHSKAVELAKLGADYIAENINGPSHPVSYVGLMLDYDFQDIGSEDQKLYVNTMISGICYDLALNSQAIKHQKFKQPTFLMTAFRVHMDDHSYNYYLRLVGVCEWADEDILKETTMTAFITAQSLSKYPYASDSVVEQMTCSN